MRIGTYLLYKCRLLPDIWSRISGQYPELKIEILSISENQSREGTFSLLGTKYDLWEGIYCSSGWDGICHFLELMRTSICCAVAKSHRLTSAEVTKEYPSVRIIESSYYGVDTFPLCEINPYSLIYANKPAAGTKNNREIKNYIKKICI